jgi:hypothetical protein
LKIDSFTTTPSTVNTDLSNFPLALSRFSAVLKIPDNFGLSSSSPVGFRYIIVAKFRRVINFFEIDGSFPANSFLVEIEIQSSHVEIPTSRAGTLVDPPRIPGLFAHTDY